MDEQDIDKEHFYEFLEISSTWRNLYQAVVVNMFGEEMKISSSSTDPCKASYWFERYALYQLVRIAHNLDRPFCPDDISYHLEKKQSFYKKELAKDLPHAAYESKTLKGTIETLVHEIWSSDKWEIFLKELSIFLRAKELEEKLSVKSTRSVARLKI